jgi:hypothetical protein
MMKASCRQRQEAFIMSRDLAGGYDVTLKPLTLNVWPPP